jgi:hypothetical protein
VAEPRPDQQGLLIQLAVYGDALDIDAYARTATELLDRPREGSAR